MCNLCLLVYCHMFSKVRKNIIWAILLWFSMLQALAPLTHAHIQSDTSQQSYGIHIHSEEIVHVQDKIPTLRNHLVASNTVGMNKAVLEDVKLIVLPLLVLLFIIYGLITLSKKYTLAITFAQYLPLCLRFSSRPRAPPFLF